MKQQGGDTDGHNAPIVWDRWLLTALGLASALLCVPLLSVAYVPFLDLPQHAAINCTMMRCACRDTMFPETYRFHASL